MATTAAVLDQIDSGYVPEYVKVGMGRNAELLPVDPDTFTLWGYYDVEPTWGEPAAEPAPIYSARTKSGRLVRTDWGTCEFLGYDHGVRTISRKVRA